MIQSLTGTSRIIIAYHRALGMRAVVVGGGIIGLSSAYYLAERGIEVVLLEKGSLGTGSTGRAVGGIRSQFATPVNVELSKRSDRVWREFDSTFGIDIEHRRVGYLFLAREPSTAERFAEDVAMQNDLGVASTLLDASDLTTYCPEVDDRLYEAGTYLDCDGFADPALAVQGYARGATDAGVDIRTGVTVTDISVHHGEITGVETDDGSLDADVVVNAAGAWLAEVGALAGVELPITPRRRQIVIVDPEIPVPETVPLTIDLDTGSYFRPERDGAALVGGHFGDDEPIADAEAYRRGFDMEWAATALEHASLWVGYFGPETRIKNGWAGLYAVTPDRLPVVEEVRPGFIVAGGFSGHGFMHAPATGQVVAELAVSGETSLEGIEMLSIDRFNDASPTPERNVI